MPGDEERELRLPAVGRDLEQLPPVAVAADGTVSIPAIVSRSAAAFASMAVSTNSRSQRYGILTGPLR